MYRRRRIVALVVVLALLAACGGLIWGVVQGVGAAYRWINHDEIYAISRTSAPPTPRQTSGVPNCSSSDVSLQLTADASTVGVGGSVKFAAAINYTGTGQCLIDGSNSSRILTITTGDQTVWRSDVCTASPRKLLLSRASEMKRDEQTIAWSTSANASDTACRKDSELPKVKAGSYVARLSLKSDPSVQSDPVVITVQ
ncbi:hypothetical protein GFD22_06120 [Bifidobacterium avesanii]|uniref:Peptide ABC transporter permease n=2 Tax=Bifidobacterium avesanii TaxID=1798157 RepID=A0A7K3TIM6_9BIFI|nr:hypothetical protein [Bifidobacterium avesanii]